MLTNDVLARLGQLNRERDLAIVPGSRSSAAGRKSGPAGPDAPFSQTSDGPTSDESAQPIPSIPGEEIETDCGPHWCVEQPVGAFWPRYDRYLKRTTQPGEDAPHDGPHPRHPQLNKLAECLPGDVLMLDLETCGFAGSMVFLIGLLYQRDDQLRLIQLLARNYAEERAIFQSLWQILPQRRLLVTFNGKSFDWPVVQDRSTLHRLRPVGAGEADPPTPEWDHCDLLHHARRKWKRQLPNCRLQTLEWHVCGRRRQGDIPGRLIPEAYHHYARTGDPRQMRTILHHNALDLVTLFQLSLVLTARGSSGTPAA